MTDETLYVPFTISKNTALDRIKKQKIVEADLSGLEAVYVPYFLFDADVTGSVESTSVTQVKTVSRSTYEEYHETTTDHFLSGSVHFDNVPVNGASADELDQGISDWLKTSSDSLDHALSKAKNSCKSCFDARVIPFSFDQSSVMEEGDKKIRLLFAEGMSEGTTKKHEETVSSLGVRRVFLPAYLLRNKVGDYSYTTIVSGFSDDKVFTNLPSPDSLNLASSVISPFSLLFFGLAFCCTFVFALLSILVELDVSDFLFDDGSLFRWELFLSIPFWGALSMQKKELEKKNFRGPEPSGNLLQKACTITKSVSEKSEKIVSERNFRKNLESSSTGSGSYGSGGSHHHSSHRSGGGGRSHGGGSGAHW